MEADLEVILNLSLKLLKVKKIAQYILIHIKYFAKTKIYYLPFPGRSSWHISIFFLFFLFLVSPNPSSFIFFSFFYEMIYTFRCLSPSCSPPRLLYMECGGGTESVETLRASLRSSPVLQCFFQSPVSKLVLFCTDTVRRVLSWGVK